MFFKLLILFYLINYSLSTTSIKTYPTVELKENVPINTHIISIGENKTKLKLVLLNLGGFETNLFVIKNESLYTINEIDREQFIIEKRCFDRLYCLIEVHILVNDGEQYWVIPIHIIDENDNKPEFKYSSIDLKYREDISGGYKIPFEGAQDIDEGLNGKISYVLDCQIKKQSSIKEIKELKEKNETKVNCLSSLFELIILSQSLLNQYDQLALKYNPLNSNEIETEYELILYGIDNGLNSLINSMKINVRIDVQLKKPLFLLNEYNFIIKDLNKSETTIGTINAKSNNKKEKIIYKMLNKTINFIKLNSLTGELIYLNNNFSFHSNEIELLIEGSYLNNNLLKSFVKVNLIFRLLNNLNQISLNYQIQSNLFIQQNQNYSNQFFIKKNFPKNEILFKFQIQSKFYPFDKLILLLDNYHSLFSLLPSSSSLNNYLLKSNQHLLPNSIYYLIIKIKHQLTNQWLNNLTIQLILIDDENLCLQNRTFFLYDFNKINFIGNLKVIQTNLNVSNFSNFIIKSNQIIINQCQMLIQFNYYLNQSQYHLCSTDQICYNITNQFYSINMKNFKSFLPIRPIEIAIFCLCLVFILATITLIFVICRLRGFQLCLTIKNYLFYGKKYGLSNAQRLSSTKINQRVQSIVVRESLSPSIPTIKPKSYIYNIDELIEQERIPTINFYPQSSSPELPISLSCASSLQRGERTISNFDNEITPRTARSSSSFMQQETKQLLDIVTSNEDLDISKLASEV